MNSMLVAIDTAKAVFQVATSTAAGKVQLDRRFSRAQVIAFLSGLAPCVVIMEACGSSHWLARQVSGMGHRVALLPPHLVKPYVGRRNKTDRADAKALLEAYRNEQIKPVPIKSADQQVLTSLHALRSSCMKQRVCGLNELRAHLREHGFLIPIGAKKVVPAARLVIQDADADLPDGLRGPLAALCHQIECLEIRMAELERQIKAAADTPVVKRLLGIPGIGLLTATAIVAFVGDLHRFPTARHFASYLGLTPREHSSGSKRRLGRISKMGNPYLRGLLVHGARAALQAGKRVEHPDSLRQWALKLRTRNHHNKTTVALANKLARIAWAVVTRDTAYTPQPTRAAA